MCEHTQRYDAEIAGALTPELEGAAHSQAHARRLPQPENTVKKRGEIPSVKTDLPSGPKRP